MDPHRSPATPRKREGLHVREIDGETVVLDRDGGLMHNLNATASFILRTADGRRSEREIWEALAEAFEVPAETAEKDTLALLARLRELGILE
jgi:PqqD family protein of HPr-rel-A system